MGSLRQVNPVGGGCGFPVHIQGCYIRFRQLQRTGAGNGHAERMLFQNDVGLLACQYASGIQLKLLRNEIRSVVVRGRRLEICGFEAEYSTYKKNGSYRDLDTVDAAEIERKLGKCPNGEVLLIAHNPLFCEVYSEWGADFTFSGHVHGGVVRIPFTRIGLLSPERKFFPKYVYGLYKHGKMLLLVCGGIGKLRLFNPPEMVIYDI